MLWLSEASYKSAVEVNPMQLQDFPRPRNDNRRGVHWTTNLYPSAAAGTLSFWIAELQQMHIKWVKVLDDSGGLSLPLCQQLLAADIFPIVRLYRKAPNPGHLGGRETDTVKRLVQAGVRYFESNNEPDVTIEWKNGVIPPNSMDIVVDNFIIDADAILAAGGLPAFPAMSVDGIGDACCKRWLPGSGRTCSTRAPGSPFTTIHSIIRWTIRMTRSTRPGWHSPRKNMISRAPGPGTISRELINQWRASDKNPGKTIADDPICFWGLASGGRGRYGVHLGSQSADPDH